MKIRKTDTKKRVFCQYVFSFLCTYPLFSWIYEYQTTSHLTTDLPLLEELGYAVRSNGPHSAGFLVHTSVYSEMHLTAHWQRTVKGILEICNTFHPASCIITAE